MLRIKEVPSPNFDSRPDGLAPNTVVLHATVLDSAPAVCVRFQDPSSRVSSHYTIDRDGTIYRHVSEAARAWHAGASRMPDGRESVNDFSIGIELVNLNDGHDKYPPEQMSALRALTAEICARWPIQAIATHAAIATPRGRKTDPRGLNLTELDLPSVSKISE